MHDQQFEALADSLVRRLWRSVILPGVGLQLALFTAFSLSLSIGSLVADDDEDPPVIVASLPDEGQPPAPAIEPEPPKSEPAKQEPAEPAPASNDAPADTAADKPSAEQAAVKAEEKLRDKPAEKPLEKASQVPAAAEVVSSDQVEQLGKDTPQPPAVRELSVEPVLETRPKLPADRPAWVGAANDTSERVHRLYVASFTTNDRDKVDGDEMLDDPLVAAVRRYLDETVFPGEGAWALPITPEFVRQNLLDNSTSYVATMTTQTGTEYQKWVVLQVTPEQREYFAGQLREHKQRERMAMLGVSLVSVLGLTGLANFVFNRRRRRYPNALTPVTMAIMPGAGQAGGADNAMHYVAAAAAPKMVCKAQPKKRSCIRKSLIMTVVIVVVFAFMVPALVVKAKHRAQRTEHTRISVDGKVWEIKTTTPLFEHALSDSN